MVETLFAQYFSRNKVADEKGFPWFGDHLRYTGPGTTDYNKQVSDHLYDIAFNHGPKNGTLHFLPLDQRREHPGGNALSSNKPRTRLNDDYFDPIRMLTLAEDLDMNGLALHPDWAQIHKSMGLKVPLILKVTGTTNIATRATGKPESDLLLHGVQGIMGAARDLEAKAIGATYYMGSSANPFVARDMAIVFEAAKQVGLPVIVWSYPRGPEVDKLGQDAFHTVFGAVTDGCSIGAHVLKVNKPSAPTPEQKAYALENYGPLKGTVAWEEKNTDLRTMLSTLSETAHESGVGLILSGGSKSDPYGVLDLVQVAMDGGVDGIINGRNISTTEADPTGAETNNQMSQLEMLEETRRILADYARYRLGV